MARKMIDTFKPGDEYLGHFSSCTMMLVADPRLDVLQAKVQLLNQGIVMLTTFST